MIAATALALGAQLITADDKLRALPGLTTVCSSLVAQLTRQVRDSASSPQTRQHCHSERDNAQSQSK